MNRMDFKSCCGEFGMTKQWPIIIASNQTTTKKLWLAFFFDLIAMENNECFVCFNRDSFVC